ncbi:MFS transporter [Clostridium luticellarii]|uniref:Putative transport protein HsrA n=1 Tax=Clostridium luticellarii TaxID=1691940 RepID=A0A2T0BLR8_9CLOT|nr:MFS transporter [Clostridium luticellarii]PRR84818.1 putative transport protein HsrA [Clostridium luticellarii]
MLHVSKPKKTTEYGLVIFVLSLTTLMSAIDTNIVNIGLTTIEKSLDANFISLQWVALSYLLAVTSLIVGIGRIGDIFGKKRIFIFGIGLFTFTSLLCGASASIYELIAFRAFQGIGGSILMALSFAIAGDMIPKEKIIQGMSILTVMFDVADWFCFRTFCWRASDWRFWLEVDLSPECANRSRSAFVRPAFPSDSRH